MQILLTKEEIEKRVEELGREISAFYHGESLTLIVLLNGGMIFASDLMRHLDCRVTVDSVAVSCYDGDRNTGNLRFRTQMKMPVTGKNVLVVDDVFDTGFTLRKVMEFLKQQGCATVRSCVLLDKCEGKTTKPDWTGFQLGKCGFVVGYGMDCDEEYRNLPYIAVLKN